ncbi:unnamed protein product [Urochloa humidicola]
MGDRIPRQSHGLALPETPNGPSASSPPQCKLIPATVSPPLDGSISSQESVSLPQTEPPPHPRSASPPPSGHKPRGAATPETSPSVDALEQIQLVRPPPRPVPPPPAWVILDCQARELSGGQRKEEKFVADLVDPPGISVIKAEHELYPFRLTASRVLATDPNTALLVSVYFEEEDPSRGPRLLRLLGFEYDERYWRDLNDRPPNLILIDDLPDRVGAVAAEKRVGNIGLIVLSGGPAQDYMVAELELTRGCSIAKLHTIRGHSTAEWSLEEVFSPVSHRDWGRHGVISYDRNLWWVDLSWGLLSCDPSSDSPVLTFEPLPPGSVLEATTHDVRRYRYVGVSSGKLCFLEISPKCVSLWTHGAESGGWLHEVTADLSDIWADEGYQRAKLPAMRPSIALLHPFYHNFAYFFLEDRLFGVDLETKCTVCVGARDEASDSFLPWILPSVGNVSTSELRDQALELLKVAEGVPADLKRKLFDIVNASKVIEECMAYIIGNIDKWPLENLNEEKFSAVIGYDDVFSEGEVLSSSNTAIQGKIENVLSQIVASVAKDVDDGIQLMYRMTWIALIENKEEKVHRIMAHHFSATMEDIGYEAAKDLLTSGVEFDFLNDCFDRGDYLHKLEFFGREILAMMKQWDGQHSELVDTFVQAATGSNLHEEQDDIRIVTSCLEVLPEEKKLEPSSSSSA